MTESLDRARRKDHFVRNAIKNEQRNKIKDAERREHQRQSAAGYRKINGRVYRLAATHRSRGAAEDEAAQKGTFTSVQRLPDGWGLYVLSSEEPSWLDRLRAVSKKGDAEPDGSA